MASLGDVGPVVKEIGVWGLIKRVYKETLDDHVFVYASALSYAWLFALFPMLIFLVSLLPFLPVGVRSSGKELIEESVRTAFPGQAAQEVLGNPRIAHLLNSLFDERRGAVVSVSLIVALYAASNGLSAIMTAMDRCYDIDNGRPFYKAKPISLLLTTILTAMIIIVMAMIPIGSFLRNWIVGHGLVIPGVDWELKEWMVYAFDMARYFVGLTIGFAILSIVYNFAPSVRMQWRLISPGAVFCFVAWVMMGTAFRVYLTLTGGTSYSKTFGPAAGLAILMLIFFLYGVVLLIGAELNAELDKVRLKVDPGTKDLRPAQKALAERIKEEKAIARRLKVPPVMPPP